MAALAEISHELGHEVRGSDIEQYLFTQDGLLQRGICIDGFDYSKFTSYDAIIIGNAFANEHPQVVAAKQSNASIYRYHEYLGKLMEGYESYSVAGTHGKTTTTGLLAHTLAAFMPTGYLIGDGNGHLNVADGAFVVESCEYKRHFLAYYPEYAIITSAEIDHVDYYKDYADYLSAYEQFSKNVKQGIALYGDDPHVMQLQIETKHKYYGLQDHNDVQAKNVLFKEEGIEFDLWIEKQYVQKVELPFAGEHLLWNSLAVLTICWMRGLELAKCIEALATFPGVRRRFNVEVERDHVYIDDYAHHPTAIALTIKAAKQKYPNKQIVAVFKPDRYSRIAYFVDGFAQAFHDADQVFICNFPANAVPEPGIHFSIDELLSKTPKAQLLLETPEEAAKMAAFENTVFLFMSSKDIYKFKDLMKTFHKN